MGEARPSLANLGLRPGESVRFRVRGQCMEPLRDGDRVQVQRRRIYWPGDVVVVRARDRWIGHRFLGYAAGRRGLVVLTQADTSRRADPAACVDRVAGAVECEVSLRARASAMQRYVGALVQRVLPAGA